MTEQERELVHLVTEWGLAEDEARRRLTDDDLWVLAPSTRPGLRDEEAVREYAVAAQTLENLVSFYQDEDERHGILWMLLADASYRASELAERAEKRLKEAS